jgi:hypothetical protein
MVFSQLLYLSRVLGNYWTCGKTEVIIEIIFVFLHSFTDTEGYIADVAYAIYDGVSRKMLQRRKIHH